MRVRLPFVVALVSWIVVGCDKPAPEGDSSAPKGLVDELIARHGEGVLAQPVVVVYDTGYVVGRGTLDAAFGDKVDALGVTPASALEAAGAPIRTPEFYRQDGIEFGVRRATDPAVVIPASAPRAIQLLLGAAGAQAVAQCEALHIDRACKAGAEVRVWLDGASASEVVLIEHGVELARGKVHKGWAVFQGAPELGDAAELELIFGEGVRCNMSKWVVDPRDSCMM